MKITIVAVAAAWLTMAFNLVHAQTSVKLSGQIYDKANHPLYGAAIRLYTTADSIFIKAALTDSAGKFTLLGLKRGAYRFSVSMLGYTTYTGNISLDTNKMLSLIRLNEIRTALREVNIVAAKTLIEKKIDRTVVNVDANVANAGSNVMEVLEKAPGVMVDQNGVISIKSKAAIIFIDDKPTYLSGADLSAYLNSLPSSTIDQIELMNNPPAKYDAAGNGGIINIRTKKGKTKGVNGGLNLSYLQGRYARTNNSFNFNYRNNKVNMFGNLGYSTINFYSDMDFYRHYINAKGDVLSNFLQNSYTRRKSESATVKVGLDYYLSDQTTVGIGLTGLFRPSAQTAPVSSIFTNAQNLHDSTVIANNSDQGQFKNAGINLNYRHQYGKKGGELTADVDYLTYQTSNNQSFINNSYQPDGALTYMDLLTGRLPATIQIYTAKTDYSHPFEDGVKFSAGAKTSYTHTDNSAAYFYTVKNATLPDYNKTNHFLYRENINAAYINANKDFKRLSVQAGLRVENTVSNGHQLGNLQKPDSTFKRSYTNLFPTLYLQYKLDSASVHQFSLNYGRRVERPYYQDLNPFISPLDKFTYYTGNPFLKPSFTDAIELSYTFKNRVTAAVSYSKTNDQVSETIEIVNGVYYSKPGNIGSSTVKSVSVDGSFDLASWFNIHIYGEVTNIHSLSDFYTGLLDTKGTFYYVKPILQFKPGRDWTLQLDGYYRSKVTNVQFIAGTQKRVNFAASKKLSSSTTLKLVINDVFHSFVNSGIINNLALTQADYRSVGDTRTAVLSLSYRFGKVVATQRKHEANGADSEQNRVKN